MNNPFATVAAPAAPAAPASNPFAPQAPVQQHRPSFPTSAPTANPFAAVVQAPPPAPPVQVPAPPTQGVAAIQAAFAFPPLNPPGEAGLGLQPVVTAPAVVVEAPAAPAAPEPAPKVRRTRKAKVVDVAPPGFTDQVNANGDTVRYADPSPQDALGFDEGHPGGDVPTLDSATTEELRDALNARGWNVTLAAS